MFCWVFIVYIVLCGGWQVQPVGSLLSSSPAVHSPAVARVCTAYVSNTGHSHRCGRSALSMTNRGSQPNPFAQHHFRRGKTRIVVITPQPFPSPSVKPDEDPTSWKEVLEKLNEQLYYGQFNGQYDKHDMEDIVMETVFLPQQPAARHNLTCSSDSGAQQETLDLLMQFAEENVPIVILLGLQNTPDAFLPYIRSLCRQAQAVTSFQCDQQLQALEYYGEYHHRFPKWKQLLKFFFQRIFSFNTGWQAEQTSPASSSELSHGSSQEEPLVARGRYEVHRQTYELVQEMWRRHTVGDLLFMLYVLLDSFSDYPIQSVHFAPATTA